MTQIRIKSRSNVYVKYPNGVPDEKEQKPTYYAFAGTRKKDIDPTILITVACKECGITEERFKSRIRDSFSTQCRQIIIHIMSQIIGMNNCQIARLIYRDRTTVIYLKKVTPNDLMVNKELSEKLNRIKIILGIGCGTVKDWVR